MISDDKKPSFLITIDTEGDNLWSKVATITTENAKFLPRFQSLCEQFGFKPTYLTNYEMVTSPIFQEFGRDIIKRNAGEIGMHLHAWNSPPEYKLTEQDSSLHPYLIEYPVNVMEEKILMITKLIEKVFNIKPFSHRAGRWAFNEKYAQILNKYGYCVDCSVTPYVSWTTNIGNPKGCGGSNYLKFPNYSYFLDLESINRIGNSQLLEVPVTIMKNQSNILKNSLRKITGISINLSKIVDRIFPSVTWLRPNRNNLKSMQNILSKCLENKHNYAEFMLHSSELMPGGSPTFQTKEHIEKLYQNLELLFRQFKDDYSGKTLKEYYQASMKSN